MMPGPDTQAELNRVAWQCRRGMRELDEMLKGFVSVHYRQLDMQQRTTLNNLLEYPDSVLLELLMGRMTATDGEIAGLVQAIRHTTTN